MEIILIAIVVTVLYVAVGFVADKTKGVVKQRQEGTVAQFPAGNHLVCAVNSLEFVFLTDAGVDAFRVQRNALANVTIREDSTIEGQPSNRAEISVLVEWQNVAGEIERRTVEFEGGDSFEAASSFVESITKYKK